MKRAVVSTLAILGIVSGSMQAYAQEDIFYDQEMTREQAIVMLVEAMDWQDGVEEYRRNPKPLPLFWDVDNVPLEPYLEVAFDQGIIVGNKEKLFEPNEKITLEEGLYIAMRARGEDVKAAANEEWFAPAKRSAELRGMLLPQDLGTGKFMRESDFAKMLPPPSTLSLRSRIVKDPIDREFLLRKPQELASSSTSSVIAQSSSVSSARARIQPIQTGIVFSDPEPVASSVSSVSSESSSSTQYSTSSEVPQYISMTPSTEFLISMPTLGIENLSVKHPEDPFTQGGLLAPLDSGVGHLFSYPGMGGPILVYGHSSWINWTQYAEIFSRINELQVGDEVYVTHDGRKFTYRVTSHEEVPASDLSAYQDASSGEELLLYTCWPKYSIARRLIVRAEPVEVVVLK